LRSWLAEVRELHHPVNNSNQRLALSLRYLGNDLFLCEFEST
jgi:hypothetical protein